MNRSFIVAVLTVTMIIMMSTAGHAIYGVHNVTCQDCHGKFAGTDRAAKANNSCVSCHSSMGEAQGKPIESESNYFGLYTAGQPATGPRSTHTWRAYSPSGPTNTSKAKVIDSTYDDYVYSVDSANLLYGYNHNAAGNGVPLANTTLCIRCHNVKLGGTYSSVRRPYLRMTKTNDALCLQCHASRSTSTHVSGSHPVFNKAYSSVYKSNTTAFRKVPLSANAYNATANLGNYLDSPNKGKLSCSTCHATHYADSNSSTIDDKYTASGLALDDVAKGLKGQLQNSKGQLLRTDPIGVTADAINVCSSCHKETKNLNHNGNGQNIQCNHCHGAHVDYTADGTNPNQYLVRRDFSNMSTAKVKLGANVQVLFNTATSSFKRSDNKGICQVCHSNLNSTIGAHTAVNTKKSDCLACHNHANGFSAVDCTSCHGQPPTTFTVGGPNGKSSKDYSLDESFTPHATHADKAYYNYACKNCHYDGTKAGYHNTGSSFTDVFIDTANTVGVLAGKAGNIPGDYNSSTKVCSNVYCHSNGSPRLGTYSTFVTPSWANGKNKILGQAAECSSCHKFGAALKTNAHEKHVTGNNIKCFVCHAATVNSADAITDRTKHADGVKNVSFAARPSNFVSVFSATWDTNTANCTNSCHTNGVGVNPTTPANWTNLSTGTCGTCHAAVPVTTLHPFHFYSTAGPKLGSSPDCSSCHDYAAGATTHANGFVNLKSGNSCSPCHPATSGTPVWNVSAQVTCESCHTGTASVVLSQSVTYTAPLKSLTAGHKQYSSSLANSKKCTSCHNASANHIGAGATEKRLLVAGNALCNTCHIPSIMGPYSTARANLLTHGVSYSGAINTFVKYTTANDYRARDCAGCHDTHGTSNYMSIRTTIAGEVIRPITMETLSTALRVTTPNGNNVYNGFCQVCHTKTSIFRRNTPPDLAHNGGKDCLDCHTHKTIKGGPELLFAFQGSGGGCGGCHGYPPASSAVMSQARMNNYTNAKIETTSGAGGAHTVAGHIPMNAKQEEGWANCNSCHYNTNHNGGGTPVKQSFVNVIVDPTKYKFNNVSAIKYNASTCSNVSCHFKKTPNWTTGL